VIKLISRAESANLVRQFTSTSSITPTLSSDPASYGASLLYTDDHKYVRPVPMQRLIVRKNLSWLGIASFAVFVFSCVLSDARLSGDKLRLFIRFFTTGVVIFIYGVLYSVILMLRRWPLTKPMAEAVGIRGEKVWLELYLFLFLQLNFMGLLTYYTTIYDSKGTVKPAWTDRLG
jgi:hypothetical protein